MKLVIDSPHGIIEIPLKGHLVLRSSSPPVLESAGVAGAGDTKEQSTATAPMDSGHLKDMRGSLMTVATLFVGMAFQAGTQPPAWMPSIKDAIAVVFGHNKEHTWEQARNALGYLLMNLVSFSIALTLVVVLPLIDNTTAASRIRYITSMVVVLAVAVATNFACGVSDDALVVNLLLGVMAAYAPRSWRSSRAICSAVS